LHFFRAIMTTIYAKDQRDGYRNYIKKIAIVGAGGQSGIWMTNALLQSGKHELTAISRTSDNSAIPKEVPVKVVDYNDHVSIVNALKGQEALIITLSVSAPQDTHNKLVRAASEVGIQWIFPNEWGYDVQDPKLDQDLSLILRNKENRRFIESLGTSHWIGVACGYWHEFSLAGGTDRFGFDFGNKHVIFLDRGEKRIQTTTFPQVGRAVAALLGLKLVPENETDQEPYLSMWKNRFVRVNSFYVSQKDMFQSILRVTGSSGSDWDIGYEPVKDRFEKANAALQNGDSSAFLKTIYSRIFYPELGEQSMENQKLGLPKEDLDQFTAVAIQMDKDGYFNNRY